MNFDQYKIAVVIPCFKVKRHITHVINDIPEFVGRIYVVDDCCPEKTGEHVKTSIQDPRIKVLFNEVNLGVGGAVCHGYKAALEESMDIVVKVDGDGQMDPRLIQQLIIPIALSEADYVKGSRFFHPAGLREMPTIRLIGNAALSLINKVVTGYWDIMDPTNGFTAINRAALEDIPLDKISPRYFFESDMLFRLSLCKAKVIDYSMEAKYGDEVSNLKIHRVLLSFPFKYIKRFTKRIIYQYVLRDFNYGSLCLMFGLLLLLVGGIFGSYKFIEYSLIKNVPAPTGLVVIPAMLIILGTQFIISFLQFDINSYPKNTLASKRNRS